MTALALTAAMVAGMAAPAYADVYYIGDGNITITKDESGTYVKHSGNDTATKDNDGKIVIKGGKRSEDTPAPGGGSSEGTTPAKSPAKSMSATPPSEDSENNDMVYLGDTKGGGEENKNQPNNTTGNEENENQTGDTTGNEENKNQPGDTSGNEENKNQPGDTSGSEENKNQPSGTTGGEENENQPGGTTGGEENENQPSGTTGGEENKNQPSDTTGGEENENQTGGTSGGEKNETDFTKKTQSSDSPVLGSQLTYTGAPINVANANDDDETRDESTTVLERAAENFNNTAKNITNYVIRIINKATGNDNTLNVTLEDVNIKANNDAALSVEGAGNTKITLKGNNKLTSGDHHAGLEHNEKSDDGSSSVGTGKLTITSEKEDGKDTGSLTATGDSGAAGIGGAWSKGAGTIEIAGGNITAISPISQSGRNDNDGGAGIGSGAKATGSTNTNIIISGGTIVNAQGGFGGAGIGSGYYGRSSTVNISGNAELKDVKGGNLAAGIGSGYGSDKVDVVIDGGTINATGGFYAAGIGSGHNSRSSVTIKSGTVNATGNGTGAGIGGSYADVTISGGNITATGYDTGAGIGGSYSGDSSKITITGGTITATGTSDAPAIGNGSVSISNTGVENAGAELDITATAPDAANAIQSNDGKTLDKVISLMENGKKGLVKLVESGTNSLSRLFHNGVYAASHFTSHSPNRVEAEMSEAEKAKYGDIASVHNWSSVRQEPNCGKDGYIEYTCMVDHCGTTFRHTLPATGQHTWNEGVVTKEPTCTELGVRTFTCTVCHNTRTEAIKALGHEYGEWVIDRDATCVEEGSKHRDCIRGDDTQTEAIPVSKTHTFGEWVITKEPTCTEKGERQRSCTISGCVVTETEELPALGHQWSDWTPVKGDSSREYRICEVCNEVEYRDVSHNSDSSISTGLRVLDPAQANIIQNVQLVQLSQINHTLYIHVAQETASLQGVLSDLTDLRSENIETVVFSTESCTSTLSLSDVAALGAGSTPFALSHSGSTSTFTVGGADHTALLR